MRESEFQAKLLKALRAHPALRNAEIWKVSDRIAGGRPDVQIFVDGKTSYFELKVAPNVPSKLQSYYLNKFGRRAGLVTFYPSSGIVAVDSFHCVNLYIAVEHIVERCLA